MTPRLKRADLVLEGGGVKGIAHVGAVAAFARHGYRFERVAGTSAGAIVGALVAAGMPVEQMVETVGALDYRRFRDPTPLTRLPILGPGLSVLFEDGAYQGDYIHEWLAHTLAALDVETFADLRYEDPALPPERRYRLVVVVADLTRGELIRLPWDYGPVYGLDADRQRVADAVRASISIPFFFEPVVLRGADGTESMLVDGGVLSNYPIDTFDRADAKPPQWPTFGVKLIGDLRTEAGRLFPVPGVLRFGPVALLESLILTMIGGHDRAQLQLPWVQARTVTVDTTTVSALDFGLDEQAKQLLYRNGDTAAECFLQGWSWQRYRREFRGRTAAPSRRA